MVVGREMMCYQLARAMGVEIRRHVIALILHVSAHLVKARGRDQVALAVNLPSDRRESRAHLIVSRSAGSGTRVIGYITPHVTFHDRAADEVWVVVVLIIDYGENLCLHTDLLKSVERREAYNAGPAEDAIIERTLVLIWGATSTSSRVRPMNLVGLTDLHFQAMLPFVLCSESGIICFEMMASKALAYIIAYIESPTIAIFIVLAH